MGAPSGRPEGRQPIERSKRSARTTLTPFLGKGAGGWQ